MLAFATRVAGQLYYIHGDHLGSTSLLTDDSGNEVSRVQYAPYGAIIEQSGTLPTDRLYTGQRFEAGIELYDYRARFYDPLVGSFLSPDSIVPNPGNPVDWNRFAYVRGNPVRYSDPSGHCPGCAFGVRGGDIDARMLIIGFGGYAATVTAVKLADEVGVSIPPFPARGPNIPPLPGYGEGELQLRDPMHIPGVTLGEGIEHLRGPFITVLDDEPRTLALEFPLLQPGVFGDNILRSELSPRYTNRSHLHVWIRHHVTKQFKGKSKFLPGEGGQDFAEEVVAKGSLTVQADGRLRYDADLGRVVGTRGETRGRVILNPETGEVITQFPQK